MEQAKKYGILVAVAIGFFVLGTAIAWAMHGLESGNKADWSAAAGTWVIGASACALTYSQIIANKRAKGEAELRQLRVMSVRARSLKVVVVNVLALQEEGEGRSRVNAVASAVDVRCGSFSLDLAVVDTDEELESAATLLEHRACALQAVCKQFLVLSASYALIGVSSCREYKWMRQEAQKLCDNVATLAEQVERKVRALQARG